MNTCRLIVIMILLTLQLPTQIQAQSDPLAELNWQLGPTTGDIGKKATITVPPGYVFLDDIETRKLMVLMENIPGDDQYVLAPSGLEWFAVFTFSPVGYVRDDEELDPQSLLDTVTKGTALGNVERRKRGWATMTILGWSFQPRYDNRSNLLEWAFLAKEDRNDSQVVNYNTRILGRKGVMEVVLVADPEVLDASVADFKRLIDGYSFAPGETYAEYRKGDRVAEFGLAALVTGGAAAVATKKGFWTVIAGALAAAWKIVSAAVVGLFIWIGSLFKKKS